MDENDVMFLISDQVEPVKREVSSLYSQVQDLDNDLCEANETIKSLQREINELKQFIYTKLSGSSVTRKNTDSTVTTSNTSC